MLWLVAVIVDALDGVGLAVDTAAREGRVGRGHVERAHARAQAADCCRGVRLDVARDAEVFGRLYHVVQAHVGSELDEDRVVRLGHRVRDRDLPPLYEIVVVYLVNLVLESEVQPAGYVGTLGRDAVS